MSSIRLLKILGRDSLVYGLAGILGRSISIFLVPIYTRVFTPTEYGIVAIVLNFVVLANILVILGLDNSIARWYYDTEDEGDRRVSLNTFFVSSLVAASALGTALGLLRNVIALRLFGEPLAADLLLLAAVNLPLSVFYTFTWNLLRIQRRPWMTAVFSLVVSVVTVGASIFFVAGLSLGVDGVLYGQLCGSVAALIFTGFLFGADLRPALFVFFRWREMLLFSLPLLPGSIAFWVVNLSGTYFVQNLMSTADAGLYQVGATVASGAGMLTTAFTMAWGPFAYSIHKHENSSTVYAQSLQVYLALGCLLAAGVMMFSHEILLLFAGERYVSSYLVAGLLSFNAVLIGVCYIAAIGTGLAKDNRAFGIAMLTSAGLLVVFNVILIPRIGKEGAAVATVLSQIVVPIVVFWHGQRLFPIPYNFGKALSIYLVTFATSLLGALLLIRANLSPFASFGGRVALLIFCCGAVFALVKGELNLSPSGMVETN